MNRFFRELRRREVFSTAGLYVGICWILIEASSVILPTFDAPDWILRVIIIAAIVGFPVMLVLAWVYDITGHGIEVQADATDTVVAPIGGRKMDFVVIGVLTVALFISVYLNVTSGPELIEEPDPISVLIADFDNQTGNPLFDGILEQALNIGVESAPHITSFQRNNAKALASRLQPDAGGLTASLATLIAVREGIKLVLAGSIEPSGSGYRVGVEGLDPSESTMIFEVTGNAESTDTVLQVVGDLSREVREELGDTTLSDDVSPIAETFTAASIEAAQYYIRGLEAGFQGKHEEAIELYRQAAEEDPNFGRAYSSWALSLYSLGRTDEAAELWKKAATLLDTMTERERLRTLGLYYAGVTGNLENAKETFAELIEKYPADAAAHNNLAVTSFLTLDFETASREGKAILDIYPNSQLYRSNYGLYSMYSGDFQAGAAQAQILIEDDPEYGTSYLLLAMAALSENDFDAARDAYAKMAEATKSPHTESTANLGMADVSIYAGEFDTVESILLPAIQSDKEIGNDRAAATKLLALAESKAAAGYLAPALTNVRQALELAQSNSHVVPAARLFVAAGEFSAAADIAAKLTQTLQGQPRAYGLMIEGMIASAQGRHIEAIDTLRSAIELADLWLIRFELGKAYLAAKFYAEALDEFMHCAERRGEATAIFLDDTPTYRYLAELPYWTARAQQGLGMQSAASESFAAFLELRPQGGPLADDVRQQLP